MNRKVRALAALALAGALAACSDRNAGAPFVPQGVRGAVAHPAMAYVRPIDAGRRASAAPMTAVVVMQYNRQAELDAFTDALAHRQHPRYLTPAQFVARYAPTVAQQQRVIDALRAHGLRIDKTYQNRTILDISGATGAFERYFATEIHDFDQGKYGRRYAEVRPLHVPTEIAPLVKVVDARTVVSMHSDAMILESPSLPQTELAQLPAIVLPHEPAAGAVPDAGTNVVRNPGFESGHLRPWTTCDSSSTKNKATIQKVHPHSGRFDAYAGTYQGQPEPNGLTSVCQIVTIPAGATLTAWTWGISNDHTSSVHQFGGIYNSTTGKPIKTVFITNKNSTAWREYTADLSAYAGQNVYLAFGVIGNGAHRNKTIGQLVDDISLTGASATPPPCTPSTFPNATPTPNAGPDQGWGPQAVANAFYLPANYDYPGACQTAAIVIDKEVNATDLSTYLQQYGIAQTGTVTYELIDSAPAVNDDEGEATLDLETISSLAPAANVIVYVTGDLGDQHIVDAYNQALTDAKATVVNSSFGGCEDNVFGPATDAIAQQGATTGVTFSASSGDQGAGCYAGNPPFPFGVSSPASGPHFVAVGGTQSTSPAGPSTCLGASATTIANPVVWSDCVGAGGGGISTVWKPAPANQSGISGASTAGRNVPDIAMPAAYDDFYFTGGNPNGWGLIWGTSWASPIYVAMQSEINEACGKPEWGSSLLYADFAANQYFSFIDVTGGSNPNTNGTGSYSAATGFDNVSGIGMLLGTQLAQKECNAPSGIRLNRVVRPTR